MKKWQKTVFRMAPLPALLYLYWRNLRRQGDGWRERKRLFSDFVRERPGERCLQIGVRGKKFGENWVSVDLCDPSPEIDYHCDVAELPFADGAFDRVTCNAILEHVADPLKSIRELHRVLKVGGEIWLEVPFIEPYHPDPQDYWRVTTEGMKQWMHEFRTLQCSVFSIHRCSFYAGVFYWGKKTAPGI